MMRLILFVAVLAMLMIAFAAIMSVLRSLGPTPQPQEDTMPQTVQRIAYVLLIVLMFGVASGWLGAA